MQTYTKSANKSTTEKENLSFLKEIFVPEPNYTQIPNILLDSVMRLVSGSEWKILSAISRETFGWRRSWHDISLSFLEENTGLLRQAVISGINGLIEKGLVQKKKTGKTGAEKSWYKLVMRRAPNEQNNPPQYLKKSEVLETKKRSNNFDQCDFHTGVKIIPNKERATLFKNNTKSSDHIPKSPELDKKSTPPSSAIIFKDDKREIKVDTEIYAKLENEIGKVELAETIESIKSWLEENQNRRIKNTGIERKIRQWNERFQRTKKDLARREEIKQADQRDENAKIMAAEIEKNRQFFQVIKTEYDLDGVVKENQYGIQLKKDINASCRFSDQRFIEFLQTLIKTIKPNKNINKQEN